MSTDGRDVEVAVGILRVMIRNFGVEGVLQLTEVARSREYSPMPLSDETDVHELELSTRSMNCLKTEGLTTVGAIREALRKNKYALLRIPMMGRRSTNEVLAAIGELN